MMIAVSPMMRPMPRTTPLAMLGRIDGQQHAADRRGARLAERVGGLAQPLRELRAAPRVSMPTMSGSASSDITIPAARNDSPETAPPLALCERNPKKPRAKISSPKIASTMLGTPAIISIPDSTVRASHAGGRTRSATPRSRRPAGAAISDAERRDDQGADRSGRGSLRDWLWLRAAAPAMSRTAAGCR